MVGECDGAEAGGGKALLRVLVLAERFQKAGASSRQRPPSRLPLAAAEDGEIYTRGANVVCIVVGMPIHTNL